MSSSAAWASASSSVVHVDSERCGRGSQSGGASTANESSGSISLSKSISLLGIAGNADDGEGGDSTKHGERTSNKISQVV